MDAKHDSTVVPQTAQVKQPDTIDQLQARIRELEQRVAEKGNATPGLRFAVSEKGGVSVYGLGRFPVTQYEGQWNRLLDAADDLRAFLKANSDKLAKKPEGYKSQEPSVRSTKVTAKAGK